MESCCRACSRSDDFRRFSLYAVAEVSQEVIANMIRDTSDTQVSTEDGLPQQICPDCLMTLSLAYSFRKQCRRSDAKFREYWGGRTPSQSVDQQQHQQQQQQQSQQHQLPRRSQSQIPEESSFEAVATTIKEEVDIYDYEYSVPAGHDNQWVIQNPRTIGEGAMTVVHNTGGHYYDEGAASETGAAPDRDGHGMLHPMDDAAEMGESSGLGQKDDKLKKNVPNPERYSQRIRRQIPPKLASKRKATVYVTPASSTQPTETCKSATHLQISKIWPKKEPKEAMDAVQTNTSLDDVAAMFTIPTRTLQPYATHCEESRWHRGIPSWSDEQMAEALKAIQHGMSFRIAAATYGISRATLQRRTKQYGIQCPNVKNWTEEQMANALEAIRNGMSSSEVAAIYNIPLGAIIDRAKRCGLR